MALAGFLVQMGAIGEMGLGVVGVCFRMAAISPKIKGFMVRIPYWYLNVMWYMVHIQG